ncbi:MAG TPA: helix-turn-helix domain-containing protein [Ktedonobacterales bacterium]|jgi:DNA-binding transcriptional ArsR family regulator
MDDNDIPEVYNIETVEQLRAVADELRMRIGSALERRAMTVTQLGALLEEPPAKIHYHVRELERVGLLRLVATREKGGILEKYYRTVARNINVPGTILRGMTPDEGAAAANEQLQLINQGFLRTLTDGIRRQAFEADAAPMIGITTEHVWLTLDDAKRLGAAMRALFDPYSEPRGSAGERAVTYNQIVYETHTPAAERLADSGVGTSADADDDAAASPSAATSARPLARAKPGARRSFVAGLTAYSRKDLEQVVAEGRPLDLTVMGYCSFARDIPAELADRAIARFHHRGVLFASPAVREVLKRKEG